MPSLIPGYEYDIFISYRQNDNRSGWVTEFVKALEEELAATIKDRVSVYFDANPHDGLLETHDVDKSLKGKLKCVIFIPILSQTYCDPKSFAWKQEFCAFNEMAKGDLLGPVIRLSNGNIASRILPVRIHELDEEDKASIESALGTALRPVDFIFRSAGVNRPLRAKDDEGAARSGQFLYRDQINKLANAIKALIAGITKPGGSRASERVLPAPQKSRLTGLMARVGAFVVLLVVIYLVIPKNEQPISIAVLAFKDMSEGKDQEHLADGISEELINMLTHVPALEVTARTSSFKFKNEREDVPTIASKLNVEYVLEGSVRPTTDRIRITAQLIDGSTGRHLWSKNFEREKGDVLKLEDEIALEVVRSLKGTLLGEYLDFGERQANQEALNLFLQGKYNTMHHKPDIAVKNFMAAIRIDSLYAKAWAGLAWAYTISAPADTITFAELIERQAKFARKAYTLNPREPDAVRAMIQMYLAALDFRGASKLVRESNASESTDPELLDFVAFVHKIEGNMDESIRLTRKSCEKDPLNYLHHAFLAEHYVSAGDLRNAELHVRTAMDLAKDIPWSKSYIFNVHFFKGDYAEALACLDTGATLQRFFPLYAIGRTKEAEQILESAKYSPQTSSVQVATCYAFANKFDSAFHYIEKARKVNDVGLLFMRSDPYVPAPFKKDPRFVALMKDMKISRGE